MVHRTGEPGLERGVRRRALAGGVARDPQWRLRALGDDLESLEINPLLVEGSTVEALDAVVTWTDKYQ